MESADKVRDEFDRIARALDDEQKESFAWEERNDAIVRGLLERLPSPCPEALDIGCGMGAVTSLLADRCDRVLALDLSPEMIRVARERLKDHTNVEFIVADVLEWEFPPGRFDCIATKTALHHMPLDAILTKMKAGLRPGGVLLVIDLYEPRSRKGPRISRGIKRMLRWALRPFRNSLRPVPAAPRRMRWKHDPDETYLPLEEVRRVCRVALPGAELRTYEPKRFYSIVWSRPPGPFRETDRGKPAQKTSLHEHG